MVQQPYSPTPQPQQNPVNTVLIVVCLGLAVLLLGVVAVVGLRMVGPRPTTPPQVGTTATPSNASTSPLPPPVQATPGPEAALAKALETRPSWNGRLTYSSGDWTQVKAVIGPEGASREAVVMHWDPNVAAYMVDSLTSLATPTTIYRPPTVIVQPQMPTVIGRRRDPARPRGGALVPVDTPGYDGGTPPVADPLQGNEGRPDRGNPATPDGDRVLTPADTPGRD